MSNKTMKLVATTDKFNENNLMETMQQIHKLSTDWGNESIMTTKNSWYLFCQIQSLAEIGQKISRHMKNYPDEA